MDIGEALRRVRTLRGWTQTELAHRVKEQEGVKLHPTYISMIESGSRSMNMRRFELLCKVLKYQPWSMVYNAQIIEKCKNKESV